MLLLFMNRSNMVQQANLFRKTMVTKVTFERLFLHMNHTKIYIQVTFFRTSVSQNLRSKCYLSSWIEATWFNKLIFLEKQWLQISHLNGIFCLWTILTFIFKLLFSEHFLSQNSHSKCYFSSWIEATWFSKLIFVEKQWLQSSHLKGFSCLWTILTYIFKLLV